MILMFGPPGAGKSVQAKLLHEAGKVQWLSAGKLLRERIETLPESMKKNMSKGKLVDDNLVSKTLEAALSKTNDKPEILIDGFPRRDSQVQWLKDYLKSSGRTITKIIHLKLPQQVAIQRLQGRGRLDDDEETVRHRYVQYEEEVLRVLEAFSGEGVSIHEVDGDDTVENIHQQVLSEV